jgi:integrase
LDLDPMPRAIRNPRLNTRSSREKLPPRREPYWTVISEGCALGYRRGTNGGTWVARFRDESARQNYEALGPADDARDADNLTVFSFLQAQARARDYFNRKAREGALGFTPSAGPLTVADALTAYYERYARRGGKALGRMQSTARTYILPALAEVPVPKLTRRQLEQWHEAITRSAPRVRIKPGSAQRFRVQEVDAETLRRRRATANRVLSILKAALNQAHDDGRVATTDAWAQVKAYRGVDSARLRYLSDDEARRLVNACRADFRQLVTAALLTGCRFGELAAVSTEDFNSDSGTITIRTSKSGKPRHVVLTDEGREFFTGIRIGADADLPLLTKANGRPWSASDQQRPLVAACSAAHVAAITFHGLRHTYASRLVMKGVPLPVVAAQLGHSDTRMVEKHYGHLAPTYVADTVRAAFDRMGLGHAGNVATFIPAKVRSAAGR